MSRLTTRWIAFVALAANLIAAFVLLPAFQAVADSRAYVGGRDVLDKMTKSGAVTYDETKVTDLGYSSGEPSLPIVHVAVVESRSLIRRGWLFLIANSAAFLILGVGASLPKPRVGKAT